MQEANLLGCRGDPLTSLNMPAVIGDHSLEVDLDHKRSDRRDNRSGSEDCHTDTTRRSYGHSTPDVGQKSKAFQIL